MEAGLQHAGVRGAVVLVPEHVPVPDPRQPAPHVGVPRVQVVESHLFGAGRLLAEAVHPVHLDLVEVHHRAVPVSPGLVAGVLPPGGRVGAGAAGALLAAGGARHPGPGPPAAPGHGHLAALVALVAGVGGAPAAAPGLVLAGGGVQQQLAAVSPHPRPAPQLPHGLHRAARPQAPGPASPYLGPPPPRLPQ